jgi:polyribonucleotide nucleotidyltransferase
VETGVSIDTEDDGIVLIGSSDEAMIVKARNRVDALTRELAVGDIFTGKVQRLTSFGAFVELLPGKDGLLRTEELGDMENGLELGQELTVIVREIDHMGRINLSRRALFSGPDGGPEDTTAGPPRPFQDRPRQSGPRPSFGGPGQGGTRAGPGQSRRPPPPRPAFRGPPGR